MSKDIDIEITETGSIKLTLITRDYWGRIKKRQNFTVSSHSFERALKRARITVPWDRVTRSR